MPERAEGEAGCSDFVVGDAIGGRYDLLEELSGSPLRQVYRAFDREVEVEVAIWLLRPELFGADGEAEAAAEIVRGIRHAHVLRLFDCMLIAPEGRPRRLCLSWQLGTSASLESLLAAAVPASPSQLWRYAEGLASALQAAHDKGTVHGWLSPADVVEVAGQVKLCGIGLLSGLDASSVVPHWGPDTRYLAPELVAGGAQTATASSDWYSLGGILLDLASGMREQSAGEAQASLQREQPALWAALEPALRTDAGQRPRDAAQFLAPIRLACSEPEPPQVVASTIIEAELTGAAFEPGGPDGVGGLLCDDDDDDATEIHMPGLRNAATEPDLYPVLDPESDPESESISEELVGHGTGAAIAGEAVSMKPAPSVLRPGALAGDEGVCKSPVKPVIRPLTSLPGAAEVRQDLGTYAPPRERDPGRNRKSWVLLAVALAAGAATVSVILALQSDTEAVAPPKAPTSVTSDAAVSSKRIAPPPVQAPPVALLAPCPDGMILHKDKLAADTCIDAYESPGRARRPQTGMSLEAAAAQCQEQGRRLCTGAEWELGCRLGGTESWPYGRRYRAEICNVKSGKIRLSGSSKDCRTGLGVYDMSGNVAEWVSDGQIRGGSASDGNLGRCSQVRPKPDQQDAYSDVGFRCCADAIDSGAMTD